MAHVLGEITYPVSIYDVQQVLGTQLTDLGQIIASRLFNPWAKYKPVPLALIDTVTGQWDPSAVIDPINDKWTSAATWFKGGVTGNTQAYGWTAFFSNNPLTALTPYSNYATAPGNGWTQAVPAGGVNTPYRLQDFDGYSHKAYTPPTMLNVANNPVIVPNNGTGTTITPTYLQRTTDSNTLRRRHYILPKDVLGAMWNGATVYTGFAIVKEDWSQVVTFTTDGYITITQDNIGTGDMKLQRGENYWVVPFYCDQQYPGAFVTRSNIGKISPFPFMEPTQITIDTSSSQPITGVTVSITAIDQLGVVSGTITFTDTNGGSRDITNVIVTGYIDGQAYATRNFGTVHVDASNSPVTLNYSFGIIQQSGTVTIKLFGNGILLKGPIVPIQEDPSYNS